MIAVARATGTVLAVNRPDEQRRAEIAERIAAWSPPDHDPDGAQQAFVRQVVAQAAPRTGSEARNTLSYCGAYVAWLTQAGHPLDAATAFGDELVGTYRAQLLAGRPKGSIDAICSHLRRLAPGVGLGGTTRRPGQEAPSPALSEAEPEAVLRAEVAGTIASYKPTRVADDRWAAVAAVVRQAVAAACPERPQRAADLLRSCAYLAAWVDAERRPVRIDTVLDGATIEAFIAVLARAGLVKRSLGTFSSNLHALREANGLPLRVEQLELGRDRAKAPYDSDEVDAIFRQAARVPSTARRRHAKAALALIFGAGVKPGLCGWLPPQSIIEQDGVVVVRSVRPERWDDRLTYDEDQLAAALGFEGAVRPERIRSVVALDSYAETLVAARDAALAAGDQLLLGGTSSRRNRRFSQLMKPHGQGPWVVEVDSKRAQLTWLAEAAAPLAAQLGDVTALRKLAGERSVLDHIARRLAQAS